MEVERARHFSNILSELITALAVNLPSQTVIKPYAYTALNLNVEGEIETDGSVILMDGQGELVTQLMILEVEVREMTGRIRLNNSNTIDHI